MSQEISAFPLAWPARKPRTQSYARVTGAFKSSQGRWDQTPDTTNYIAAKAITVEVARKRLSAELERLRANRVVLSTNIELRLDGYPKAQQRRLEDPGVALYFEYKKKPIVLACDRFTTVGANIAAIAYHIEGMRRAERHGVGSLEEMFTGFMALPPAMSINDWHEILGNPTSLEDAERTYRGAMKHAHPDVGGGDEAKAAALNAAIAEARKVLK